MASRSTAKKKPKPTKRKTATKGVEKPPSLTGHKAPVKKPAPDLRFYELETAILGTNQAAELIQLEGTWLRQTFLKSVDEDGEILIGPNAMALGPFVRGIIGYYRKMIKTSQANRRTAVADIRAARAARHLVETDNVVELFNANHTGLRAELEGIPAQVTRDLELRKKIQDAIYAAFKRFHSRIEKQLETEDDFSP